MNGWIERKDDGCPVPAGALVEVLHADSSRSGTIEPDWAARGGARITAWRVVTPADPTGDRRAMGDGPRVDASILAAV